MIVISTVSTALAVLYFKLRNPLKEFSFSYSMEDSNGQKHILYLDNSKAYKIEKCTTEEIGNNRVIYEGKLADNDFKEIRKLLAKCNFLKKEDIYRSADERVLNTIYFKSKGKEKRISIYSKGSAECPPSFNKLADQIQILLTNHQ